jgi:hypothetical protein
MPASPPISTYPASGILVVSVLHAVAKDTEGSSLSTSSLQDLGAVSVVVGQANVACQFGKQSVLLSLGALTGSSFLLLGNSRRGLPIVAGVAVEVDVDHRETTTLLVDLGPGQFRKKQSEQPTSLRVKPPQVCWLNPRFWRRGHRESCVVLCAFVRGCGSPFG